MLNMFAYITYTWNEKPYEVTIIFPCGGDAEKAFKTMHPDAVIDHIDYEM